MPRRVFRANVGTGEKGKVEVQQCPYGYHSTWVGGGWCPSVLRMAEQSRDWCGWNPRTLSLWPQAAPSLAAQKEVKRVVYVVCSFMVSVGHGQHEGP